MLLKDFNLLVTTARGMEEDACSEIWYLIGEMGDREVKVDKTGITGLIAAKTVLNPFTVIEKLRTVLKERPSDLRYILRAIPVEKVVHTNLAKIKQAVTELADRISLKETFRVTVEKRFTSIQTRDLIEAAAANIKRKVNLAKPNKIILIEVVGGFTGVSIVKPEDIFSTAKERT
ncbi:MAG TPA: THUMP domain-containing protein [Candidatus Bathyarchaeia archaeon]|nr:THUMP domain-containing protein [Candidatus Bathyarchaeia archaeon]